VRRALDVTIALDRAVRRRGGIQNDGIVVRVHILITSRV